MSLDGAKLLFIGEDGVEHKNVVHAKGKTFKFGYYMDCDVVLEHPDALGLQCTIDCDAFGRVTIANLCQDQVITLNGKPLKKLRPLLHNTEICIFDKKFLWFFEKDVSLVDYATPKKQTKKAEQPPNSEPGLRWRNHNTRLTIHTFSYSIKSDQGSQTAYNSADRNKSPTTCETIRTSSSDPTSTNRQSPTPSTMDDLIDLETPKPKQMSFAGQRTPLLCCTFSETVITSYSPRNNSVRAQAKSYAVVQSPSSTPKKMGTQSNATLGGFERTSSPLVVNRRPSMHLIDLTTPMKRSAPVSPLKSAFKKNRFEKPGLSRGAKDSSAESTASTVFSVHSTDEESVIELSDDGSFSPSPVIKTPPRPRTPQSLMKRAILSSAKKAIAKPLQPPAAPPPVTPSTPKSPSTAKVRFQSRSTPQRKSLAAMECKSVDRTKASNSVLGKSTQSMVTSTPFRSNHVGISSRRSSILRSPSTSLGQSNNKSSILRSPSTPLGQGNNKSRTSLMLRQALTASPRQNKTEKSAFFQETLGSPAKDKNKSRKSVSFLELSTGIASQLNRTFSVEEIQDCTNEAETASDSASAPKKGATFSPEKKSDENETDDCIVLPYADISDVNAVEKEISPVQTNEESSPGSVSDNCIVAETPIRNDTRRQSSFRPLPGVTSTSKCKSTTENVSSTILDSPRKNKNSLVGVDIFPESHSKNSHLSVPQTPQSSKSRLRKTPLSIKPSSAKNLRNIIDEEDFEGLDTVFKTPKARNLMILSSPKSVALQKPSIDSVELMHSTEFDMSTNLDDLFKTPQSELVVNRTETTIDVAGEEDSALQASLSSEKAFDKLVGRVTVEKCYVRKESTKKKGVLPLDIARDPDLPKTDIEEWIEKVNESFDCTDHDEDEISCLTADQSEVTRDPLMLSTISEGVTTTKKERIANSSLHDEIAMTIRNEQEGDQTRNESLLKDPLEVTVVTQSKKSVSPNISGIDLLDHTSESAFSETLALSDDSSEKENFELVVSTGDNGESETKKHVDISVTTARNEIEEAFENFERERKILEENRRVSTPEPKKSEVSVQSANRRKTMGTSKALGASFDVKAATEKWEKEMAFKNFVAEPVVTTKRCAVTPDEKKSSLKDHRRTMGTKFVPERELDLEAAKAERQIELEFENFEEEPAPRSVRCAKTPDGKKLSLKDNRRTMGTKFVPEKKLDLEAAKAEREMELAFKNFEDNPVPRTVRSAKTPEVMKLSLKEHRRTMGTKFVPESELDLKAAKAERELELAFENFEEEPVPTTQRIAKTPEVKKSSLKDHRRTMGTKFVPEKKLDIEAAKAEREMELAFENFQEEPVPTTERGAKTPEEKKLSLKDHRRTMGTKFVPERELDLEAAKAERELELAFENFEEEPVPTTKRIAKTPEVKKSSLKDHRRTMGTKFVPEKQLDIEAAKAEREMELAFKNFQEEPVPTTERAAKTPEVKKLSLKDHRRTMGTKFVPERELDLEAAKAEREMELAFENFQEEPVPTTERSAKTPEVKKLSLKDHRRTMGTKFVPERELDLEAAKAERELELAFENFEEEPVPSTVRYAKTPEVKKSSLKDHRRTMGTKFVPEKELDIEAAKAEREMELAFENFREEPVPITERAAKTPEAKKLSLKDHRRTMGTKFVPEKKLDIEAAKSEREMVLAFKNFREEPVPITERAAKTPEAKKLSLKDHRRTMGTKFVPEREFDLEGAKAERELELAFENFEEEPVLSTVRYAKTPEVKKSSLKDHRRTMGTKFVPEKELDLEAAKEEREKELAFENFEEEPVPSTERYAKTPEVKKSSLKDHRRTMGTKVVPEKEFDVEAAKAEREMELAFENFEEEPVLRTVRSAKTPEVKKLSLKEHRRTMGTKFVPDKELDIEAAKAEREMELAFENFEEEPVPTTERSAKTPEIKKSSLKDHRRTMGTKFVPEKELDLEAAKSEREKELAFKNFEENPVPTTVRAAKTPDVKKLSLTDHRRTVGTKFVPEKEFTLETITGNSEMASKDQSKVIADTRVLNTTSHELGLGLEVGSCDNVGIDVTRDHIQHEESDEIISSTPLLSKRRGKTTTNERKAQEKATVKSKKSADEKSHEGKTSEESLTPGEDLHKPNESSDLEGGVDEIVPSTPLHPKRRGRKPNVKKFENETVLKPAYDPVDEINEEVALKKTSAKGVYIAKASENGSQNEEADEIVPSTPLLPKRRGRKAMNTKKAENETSVETECDMEDTASQEETSEIKHASSLSLSKVKGDSVPHEGADEIVVQSMQSGRKMKKVNTSEHNAIVKIEMNASSTGDEGAFSEEMVPVQGIPKEGKSSNLVETFMTVGINRVEHVKGSRRRGISETTESNLVVKSSKETEIADDDKSLALPPPVTTTGSGSGKIADKDEHLNAEPASEDVKKEAPIPKRGRGRPARIAISAEPVLDVAIDLGKVKIEHFANDSIVTSTPGRRRGLRGAVDKDASVPGEATPVHKNVRKRQVEKYLDNQTEEESAKKSIPKRGRISDTKPEPNESQVTTSSAEEIVESNTKQQTAQINKKRTRTEVVKSELSESKTQSPLRKRGRKQENNAPEDSKSAPSPTEYDMEAETDQLIEEKEQERVRGRKEVSQKPLEKIVSGNESVNAESETITDRKPTRSRRAPVKNSSLIETDEKHSLNDVESQDKKSEDTFERKPTRSRRAAVKNNPSQEVQLTQTIEKLYDKLHTTDTESQNTKSEDTSGKKPNRSQQPTVKDNFLVENSQAMEQIDEKLPASDTESKNSKSKSSSQKRPARLRRAASKDNPPQVVEKIDDKVPAVDRESQSEKSEDTSEKKSTRLRRVAVKDNSSEENVKTIVVKLSESDTESQTSQTSKSKGPSEKKPTGLRQASGKDNPPQDVPQTVEKIEDKVPATNIESQNKKSEDTSEKKPTRSRRAAVKNDPSEESSHAIEKDDENLPASDAETHNSKSKGPSGKKTTRSRRVADKETPSQGMPETVEEAGDKLPVAEESHKNKSEDVSEKKPVRARRAAGKGTAKSATQSIEDHSNEHISLESTQSDNATENKSARLRKVTEKSSTKSAVNVSTSHADNEIVQKPTSEASSDTVISAVDLNTISEVDSSQKKPTRGRRAELRNNISIESHTEDPESDEHLAKRPARARRIPAKNNTPMEVVSSHNDEENQKSKPSTKATLRGKKGNLKNAGDDIAASASPHNTSVEAEEHEKSEIQTKPIRSRRVAELQDVEEKRTPRTRSRKPAAPTDTEDDVVEKQTPKTTRGKRAAQSKVETPAENNSIMTVDEKELPKGRVAELQKSEEKHTPKTRGRKPAAQTETESDTVDNQTPKPTRGKKVVQPKSETPAASTYKLNPEEKELPKKATRTRRAAAKNETSESEDEHHQKDSKKKITRSRKASEPTIEEEVKVLKRGNRQIQEVLTDDSSNTPKRSRRKLRT